MKQTAVEWFFKKLNENQDKTYKQIELIFNQAKEIEKEQIIKARATARRLGALGGAHYLSEADEYYNEIYKSE